jgi:hypothetical protein
MPGGRDPGVRRQAEMQQWGDDGNERDTDERRPEVGRDDRGAPLKGPISPASTACLCSVSRMSVDRCARLAHGLARVSYVAQHGGNFTWLSHPTLVERPSVAYLM